MTKIRPGRPSDVHSVLGIWRRAVDATHDFLTPEDRAAIDLEVQVLLPYLPLWVAVDANDRPVGFMSLSDLSLDALFIDPLQHGSGIGRSMVEFALRSNSYLLADVNEQNEQAVAFYKRLGFEEVGRSPTDGQGRSYPLIHMKLEVLV
ncbi:MAG TPA: acetyltransferase [Sphingomicrobium sp.]|nr:acetyltransferase [Sphingomicrobium sp.]